MSLPQILTINIQLLNTKLNANSYTSKNLQLQLEMLTTSALFQHTSPDTQGGVLRQFPAILSSGEGLSLSNFDSTHYRMLQYTKFRDF